MDAGIEGRCLTMQTKKQNGNKKCRNETNNNNKKILHTQRTNTSPNKPINK